MAPEVLALGPGPTALSPGLTASINTDLECRPPTCGSKVDVWSLGVILVEAVLVSWSRGQYAVTFRRPFLNVAIHVVSLVIPTWLIDYSPLDTIYLSLSLSVDLFLSLPLPSPSLLPPPSPCLPLSLPPSLPISLCLSLSLPSSFSLSLCVSLSSLEFTCQCSSFCRGDHCGRHCHCNNKLGESSASFKQVHVVQLLSNQCYQNSFGPVAVLKYCLKLS